MVRYLWASSHAWKRSASFCPCGLCVLRIFLFVSTVCDPPTLLIWGFLRFPPASVRPNDLLLAWYSSVCHAGCLLVFFRLPPPILYPHLLPSRYGSIYEGVADFIFRACGLTRHDCFLDIGSGLGQIVTQAAAWAGCRSLVRRADLVDLKDLKDRMDRMDHTDAAIEVHLVLGDGNYRPWQEQRASGGCFFFEVRDGVWIAITARREKAGAHTEKRCHKPYLWPAATLTDRPPLAALMYSVCAHSTLSDNILAICSHVSRACQWMELSQPHVD